MGRELKRVPLDFKYPTNMVWKGYMTPYRSQKCEACGQTGLNPATHEIERAWYDFDGNGVRWCDNITQDEVDALVEAGRLHDFTSEWKDGKWVKIEGRKVTADEVNAANIRPGLGGHDAINRWICVETRAKRLGVYGTCEHCGGEGAIWHTERFRKLAEKWKGYDPPAGEGFQLWTTTTEGGPVSPVFATLDELCAWCEHGATTFGSQKASAAEWKSMLDSNFVYHQEGSNVFM